MGLWHKESEWNQLDWRQDEESAIFQNWQTFSRYMAARLKNCHIDLSVTMSVSKEAGR